MRTATDLRDAVESAKRNEQTMARCPAHDDGNASLSVGPGTDEQPVVFFCHAGCEPVDIIKEAGMSWADVCAPLEENRNDDEWTPQGNASHVYRYYDEQGTEVFQALRIPQPGGGKTFSQRHMGPDGRWRWNLQGVRRVLYRLPQIIAAVQEGREIVIVEGEKDADKAARDGLAATTSPMGAGKWRTEYGEPIQGTFVTIVADNDESGTGMEHAETIYNDLTENWGCQARIVVSTLANCKDYSDHRAHGGTYESLVTTRTSVRQQAPVGLGIQEFLDTDFPEGVEIIPGMLAEANVAILVGPEGHGKSLLMRQIATKCASGLHPFTTLPIEPLRVLFIDAENPEAQAQYDWRMLAGLCARHSGEPISNERLRILSEWRSEPDLITPEGQSWLFSHVENFRPQLVLMGPVQNLVGRDVKDDEVVRKLKRTVNGARAICGSAFVIEHHAPHRAPGDKERQMRPYGSSLFMKWPDYGYGLKTTEDEGVYDLYPFRKPRVRSRAWPGRVRWGREGTLEFPWEEAEPEGAQVYQFPRS